MIRINENYSKLQASYLFSDIAKRVAAYQKAHPDQEIIKLGIGDVTRPLPPACIRAFHQAVDELADAATFRGYGPEQGYDFLREKIARHDFQERGADISADEIFVSDGAKCDNGNIQEVFATDITVAIPDPVYPVYLDTNVMAGRTGAFADGRYAGVVYMAGTRENGFIPDLPPGKVDLIYLCFPNNPTGATITRPQLKRWVDYARGAKAIILFDAAYEVFIRDAACPTRSLRSRAPGRWRSSSAASPRWPGLPEPAARTRSCRNPAWPTRQPASRARCTPSGTGGTRPSSTASPTPCSAQPRPSLAPKAWLSAGSFPTITCAMRP